MKRFFTFLKTELKLSLRDMNMPIFAIIMPLVIFIILGIIYGTKPAYDGADLYIHGAVFRSRQRSCYLCKRTYGSAAGSIRPSRDEDPQAAACHAGLPGIRSGR